MRGKGGPPREDLPLVARLLGVRLEWLLSGEPPMRSGPPDVESAAFRQIVTIVEQATAPALSADQKAALARAKVPGTRRKKPGPKRKGGKE